MSQQLVCHPMYVSLRTRWSRRMLMDERTPGPVIRARVGDVLRLTVTNPARNTDPHHIDLHAVTGQGGGAEDTTVALGESATIEARLLYPGFFMDHCAYGDVPSHISHGMHSGILVDPVEPLPEVDHSRRRHRPLASHRRGVNNGMW